ncbi:hypothetical protein VCHA50O413_180005 [Vibrio chagasii]|nr:hypothetical protein VCHA34P114_260001 [Vibrio chagasii]CAH6916810.1 hypothetical protein VCHA50O409_180007 [Vibrio chagasii]CAH6949877.1 hypothetical protein VCHA50O402_170005 [Vibrio chagasii]CAH6964820.1 hypothetical protein VCHA50O405_180007 [Vibrio chagasii]CAH7005406.1 hypothetical protein VCHA50O413_180005 [Vibrio chagasii]
MTNISMFNLIFRGHNDTTATRYEMNNLHSPLVAWLGVKLASLPQWKIFSLFPQNA